MRTPVSAPATKPGPWLARVVRRFAVLVILGWLALAALVSLGVPTLEQVAKERAVSMSVKEAPSIIAQKHIAAVFDEPDNQSSAMVVLESEQPLGDVAQAVPEVGNVLVGKCLGHVLVNSRKRGLPRPIAYDINLQRKR